MKNAAKAKDTIRKLLSAQRLAVLSTYGNSQPYGTLVAFASTEDLRDILFATGRATRKYANMQLEPRVALVIDNRQNAERDFSDAVAVTALGRAEEVREREKSAFVPVYLRKHPYLDDFVSSPSCALIRVLVEKYILVSRFQDVRELKVR